MTCLRHIVTAVFFTIVIGFSSVARAEDSDPCLGPRGNKTFTFPEFLTLFSAKLSDDKTSYQITWACGSNNTFHFMISEKDVHEFSLSTYEIVYPNGWWDGTKRINAWTGLTIEMQSFSRSVSVAKEKVELRLILPGIRVMKENDSLSPNTYRQRRELWNALQRALRASAKTKPSIVLKDVRVDMREQQTYGCPVPGKLEIPSLKLDFGEPSAILHNDKSLWQRKQ